MKVSDMIMRKGHFAFFFVVVGLVLFVEVLADKTIRGRQVVEANAVCVPLKRGISGGGSIVLDVRCGDHTASIFDNEVILSHFENPMNPLTCDIYRSGQVSCDALKSQDEKVSM